MSVLSKNKNNRKESTIIIRFFCYLEHYLQMRELSHTYNNYVLADKDSYSLFS